MVMPSLLYIYIVNWNSNLNRIAFILEKKTVAEDVNIIILLPSS